MGKKVSFSQLVTGKKEDTHIHLDAMVIRVHTDSYDVRTSNGEVRKYIPNITSGIFVNGDSVVVLSDIDTDDYRIIGRGRRLSFVSEIKMVEV